MTKREWMRKSSVAVMLSTSLLMFAEGGQAATAFASTQEAAKAAEVVNLAKSLVGKDYKYNAEGPTAFGSAGFVTYIYGKVGMELNDSISSLAKAGQGVNKNDLQPGDILLFATSGRSTPSYVGIYVGNDTFIYASAGEDEVITKRFSSVADNLLDARRLLQADSGEEPAPQPSKPSDVSGIAKSLVGKDYKSGAEGPDAFGSAGFITYVFGQVGIKLEESISSINRAGTKVDSAKVQPGDIVLFSSSGGSTPNYGGIYVGNDTFIYSSEGQDEVITKSFSSKLEDLVSVRRVLGNGGVEQPDEDNEPAPAPQPKPQPAPSNNIGQKVIEAGLKYLGIPYKFGDSRSDNRYMDCSDFTYNAYKDVGIKIPTNSRSQRDFVEEKGTVVKDLDDLQVGDLIFMMSYKGSKASDYKGIDKSAQRITHVGIYYGDGKILHTYGSGGVKVTDFFGTSWEYRTVTAGRPY